MSQVKVMAIKDRSLEETPTWALAAVCFVILFISIMIEYFLHFIGHWFKRKNKKALYEALEKVKAGKFTILYRLYIITLELMLLGFISLLLVVLQSPVSQICIPERIAATWHPCSSQQELAKYSKDYIDDGRKILEDYDSNDFYSPRRSLATKGESSIGICIWYPPIAYIHLRARCISYSLLHYNLCFGENQDEEMEIMGERDQNA
ncbi:hypothetical protein HID58_010037 [Brassica napus]|uniref:MLO-like protein n=1 Tax=Brassica napus TaxID=3708 RepID=A0ABQ8DWU1_BRANA|nr:hypothetical protein HID58_010037 [Brassica napus]